MTVEEAGGRPRVHHQGLPDEVLYEPAGLTEIQRNALRGLGHLLREDSYTFGDVNTIRRDANIWIGIADPRRAGGAFGY